MQLLLLLSLLLLLLSLLLLLLSGPVLFKPASRACISSSDSDAVRVTPAD
jgi:hypothetical protein